MTRSFIMRKILVPSVDHSYHEMNILKAKVVYNKEYNTYTEYFGDEYLEDGDEVIEREIAR